MTRKRLSALVALATLVAFADSPATLVDWSQDATTSQVTVNYRLAGPEPRIVTLDVLTNGVSIGAGNVALVSGDANRLIEPDANAVRTIKWRPDLTWAGHLFTNGEIAAQIVAWPTNNPPDYMAVNLALTNGVGKAWRVNYYTCAEALPGGISNDVWRGEMLLMRRIHAAGREFMMGTPVFEAFHITSLNSVSAYDPNGTMNALPEKARPVAFTKDWYIGVFAITSMQYDYICNTWNSYAGVTSGFPGWQFWKAPLNGISWNGARGAGTWPGGEPAADSTLGKLRAHTGIAFDMPTEAQWEYSCRAGTITSLNNGKEISGSRYARDPNNAAACEVMWAYCQSDATMTANSMTASLGWRFPVGILKPNAWGLYDMHGSVLEWCLDWVDGEELPSSLAIDPIGLASSSLNLKAIRGGAGAYWPLQARSGARQGIVPTYGGATGLRVVCPAIAVK